MTQPRDSRSHEDMMSVIIAARNEEKYLGACLGALAAQDQGAGVVEVIVAANGCADQTVRIARDFGAKFAERGWTLVVLVLSKGSKVGALNTADHKAQGSARIYLDADVVCDPALLGQLRNALDACDPVYATGTLSVARADSWVTRAYAGIWTQLPFVKGGAVGAGLFAVNAAGRARWDEFPQIISDDTFVRMQFSPDERVEVNAPYTWPMVEGLRNLVRVRRRQDAGVHEIHERFPEIVVNEGKGRIGVADMFSLFVRAPLGFIIYLMVHVAVRLRPAAPEWSRGR